MCGRYQIGRDIGYGIFFLYIMKRQKSEGVREIKKKNLNWKLLEENRVNFKLIFFFHILKDFNKMI